MRLGCVVGVLLALIAGSAAAQSIGVSLADRNRQTAQVLRSAMVDRDRDLFDVDLDIARPAEDASRQLTQVRAFIADGAAAIIVYAADPRATLPISDVAAMSGVPLVYVVDAPVNANSLPANQGMVVSNDVEATLRQTGEVCRQLAASRDGDAPARLLVLQGEPGSVRTRIRSQSIRNAIARGECDFIQIAAEKAANGDRETAHSVMTAWLETDIAFDAVIANDDAMALGAADALDEAGIDPNAVVVAGIGATPDGLRAVRDRRIDVTIFTDTWAQGARAIDTALSIVRGRTERPRIHVPSQLVTTETIDRFLPGN